MSALHFRGPIRAIPAVAPRHIVIPRGKLVPRSHIHQSRSVQGRRRCFHAFLIHRQPGDFGSKRFENETPLRDIRGPPCTRDRLDLEKDAQSNQALPECQKQSPPARERTYSPRRAQIIGQSFAQRTVSQRSHAISRLAGARRKSRATAAPTELSGTNRQPAGSREKRG